MARKVRGQVVVANGLIIATNKWIGRANLFTYTDILMAPGYVMREHVYIRLFNGGTR